MGLLWRPRLVVAPIPTFSSPTAPSPPAPVPAPTPPADARLLATGGVPLVVLGSQRGRDEDPVHERRRHRQRVIAGVAVGIVHRHAAQALRGAHYAEGLLDVGGRQGGPWHAEGRSSTFLS